MRNNSKDETLKRNYIQKYQYLIAEYEQVKEGKHPAFLRAKDFYLAQGDAAPDRSTAAHRFGNNLAS